MKTLNENGTIITRKHPTLFFGQTVDILGFNAFSDELTIKPHGDSKKYNLNFNEVWPASCTKNCQYDELNKQLDLLGEFDYLKK
jgi:hypothetical protein